MSDDCCLLVTSSPTPAQEDCARLKLVYASRQSDAHQLWRQSLQCCWTSSLELSDRRTSDNWTVTEPGVISRGSRGNAVQIVTVKERIMDDIANHIPAKMHYRFTFCIYNLNIFSGYDTSVTCRSAPQCLDLTLISAWLASVPILFLFYEMTAALKTFLCA